MASWKHTIDISAAMEMEDPRVVLQALHDELEKIKGSDAHAEWGRQDLMQECKDTLAMDNVYGEDVDIILERAYNWGDFLHECFINTFGN